MCCNLKITPFIKQSFAVSGIVMSVISYGFTIGYNATLFSELRKTKEIVLDIHSESWLASLIGITLLFGSVFGSIIMETIGRKIAILTSSILIIFSWTSFSFASSFPVLLIAKILQGLSVGIGTNVGSILIGEYTSPRYRGPFIATIPTSILLGTLISHAFGMYYSWHNLSTILGIFSLPGLLLTIFSPESPSYLAMKGRYDECRRVFRWLRGPREDDEVEALIKTDMIIKETRKDFRESFIDIIKQRIIYVITAFKKREFRIPIIIILHLNAINQFCGSMVNDMYALDMHTALYGTDIHMFNVITSLDIVRLIAVLTAIYITSRLKRRSILLIFVSLNVIMNLCVAGHIYARKHNMLPAYHIVIGIFIHHCHYLIFGIGSVTLLFVISGEIFPFVYRGLCGVMSSVICSIYMFGNIKSAPYLFALIGVEGSFCLYALILLYSMVVVLILLPETKDRTLQEIEDEFRGYVLGVDEEAIELKDIKSSDKLTP